MKPNLWIAALAFFSALAFGGGVILHGPLTPPAAAPAGGIETSKLLAQGHHVKGKAEPSPKAAAPAAPQAQGPQAQGPAFPLMLGGAAGLLLSALAGLFALSALEKSQPQAARRLRDAELALRQKQKAEHEAQQAALQTQLQEAKQRKAETEALRDQVSRQFQEFFRTLPVACFCFAANGRIIRWNAACETLYGIPAAAALESTLWDTIVPATERGEAEENLSRVLAGESLLAAERWDRVAGGERARLRCSMVPLYDAEGVILGGLSAGVDISEYTLLQTQAASLAAERDAAVQAADAAAALAEMSRASAASLVPAESSRQEIAGHAEFHARLEEEIARASRYHSSLSLVLIDTLNGKAGDEALQAVLAVIKTKIRTIDVLARLAPGKFAVILPETGEAGARVVAERMQTGLAGAGLSGQPPLTACFGVTQLTPEVSGADALVLRAQDALQKARSCGPNTVTHYQDLTPHDLAQSAPLKAAPRTPSRPRSAKKVEA